MTFADAIAAHEHDEEQDRLAADQTPAKRCGECRLGLGVHTPSDPYCDHHQTPAADSERVEQVRARDAAAAKGPWLHEPWGGQNQNGDYTGGNVFDADGEYLVSDIADVDGAFIAHARDDVPWLLAEHTRLTALLAEQAASIERATVVVDAAKAWRHARLHGTSARIVAALENLMIALEPYDNPAATLGSQRTEGQG